MNHPKTDLVRMLTADHSELRATDEGRLMKGYPVVFNKKTRIRSWEGDFIEQVSPGALRKTLRENGPNVKVLFNHGMDPQIGDKPLGKPAVMREDSNGLYTETPLSDTSYNRDLAVLINDGAIDGMSFRFSVVKEDWNLKPGRSSGNPDGLPERTITELKLAEFGPVTFPAYQATEVGMRSAGEFAVWQQLTPERRAEALRVFGMTDHSTHMDGAADGTPDMRAADNENTVEPAVTATQRVSKNERAAALRTHGVTNYEPPKAA